MRVLAPILLTVACSAGGTPESTPTDTVCSAIEGVEATGFVDVARLGVFVARVDTDLLAVLGSDYVGGLQHELALELVDISDRSSPVIVGAHYEPGRATGLAAADGEHVLITHDRGVMVFDTSDPAVPRAIGAYDLPRASGVAADGGIAYVTFSNGENTDQSGLVVLDLDDPTSPIRVGAFEATGGINSVAVADGLAYVASESALLVLDISDRAAPSEVTRYGTEHRVFGVELAGSHAYLANFASGIQILDIGVPGEPRHVSTIPTEIVNYDVAVAGNHAFIPDDMLGIKLVDITNPPQPSILDTYRPPSWARDVVVVDNWAYVTEFLTGRTGRLYALRLCPAR